MPLPADDTRNVPATTAVVFRSVKAALLSQSERRLWSFSPVRRRAREWFAPLGPRPVKTRSRALLGIGDGTQTASHKHHFLRNRHTVSWKPEIPCVCVGDRPQDVVVFIYAPPLNLMWLPLHRAPPMPYHGRRPSHLIVFPLSATGGAQGRDIFVAFRPAKAALCFAEQKVSTPRRAQTGIRD